MTIKRKIVITFIGSIIIAIIVFIVIVWLLLRSTLWGEQLNEKDLKSVANQLATELSDVEDYKSTESTVKQYKEQYPMMDFEVLTKDFEMIYTTNEKDTTLALAIERLSNHASWSQQEWVVGKTYRLANGGEGVVLVSIDKKYYQSILLAFNSKGQGIMGQIVLIGTITTISIVALFAYFFTKTLSNRFMYFYQQMNQFEMNQVSLRIEDQGNDELNDLAQVFNQMAEKIERQIAEMKEMQLRKHKMVSHLSHDLRTPLTIIIGYMEALENDVYNDLNDRKKILKTIQTSAHTMEELLENLLELVKLELNQTKLTMVKQDICEMVRQVLIEFASLLEDNDFQVDVHIPEEVVEVKVDQLSLKRILHNIFINAIKYGKEGKYLSVRLKQKDNKVVVSMENRGAGIKDDDHEVIFQTFYRTDLKQQKGWDSRGLGLAISKELIELQKGRIHVESNGDDKTIFSIELPLDI